MNVSCLQSPSHESFRSNRKGIIRETSRFRMRIYGNDHADNKIIGMQYEDMLQCKQYTEQVEKHQFSAKEEKYDGYHTPSHTTMCFYMKRWLQAGEKCIDNSYINDC